MESADKDAKTFKMLDPITYKEAQHSPSEIHETRINCYHYGRANCTPAQFKFKDSHSLKCKKLGRISPACQSTRPMQQKQTDTHRRKHKAQYVQDETQLSDAAFSEVDSSDEDFKLHRIGRQSPEPIIISLWLNGYRHDMEVDIRRSSIFCDIGNYQETNVF